MAQQYDPTEVNVLVNGEVVTGFAEDSMVTAEPIEDKIELHKGTQGEGTFVINANDGGEINITLAHNSPSLDTLKSLYDGDEIFAIDIQDNNEDFNESAGGSEAMVSNIGSMERGGGVSDREVTILVNEYENV